MTTRNISRQSNRSRQQRTGPPENDSLEDPVGDMSACCLDQRFNLANEGYEDTFRWLLLSRDSGGGSELRDLEKSVASLYETLEEKIKATSFINGLTRQTEWLATIANHTSAMGALARVLREEGRKSFSLRFNIVSIFFSMSFFPKFHQVLLEQKVGKTTLNILILEVQCMENRIQLEETAAIPARLNTGDSTRSFTFQTAKQEKLLFMSISLLLNIAEDLTVEKKMEKFNLVDYLCKVLVRKSFALLIITVTFLKKLSIFKQNLDSMKENGIIYRLSVLIPCQHESLLLAVLRLLWNLSFDSGLRTDMVKCKVVQALEMLLKENKFENLVFGLLYHLSMDAEGRQAFMETDIVPMMVQIMTVEPRQRTTGELVALAVNLTAFPENCEIICRSQGLERLILRAIQFNDPLLFKVIKNVSRIETAKHLIIRFLPALVEVVRRPDSCIFLQMEVMTIFNNVASVSNIFGQVLEDTVLLQYFSAQLKNSFIEDDLFLQIIVYVGSICSERVAVKIAESGLVRRICAQIPQRKSDSDIVLQLLWTVGQFLLYESTRKEVVACDKVVVSILKLSRVLLLFILWIKVVRQLLERAYGSNDENYHGVFTDSNKAVASLAEILVNTVVEFDAPWCAKIKWLKFASYTTKPIADSEDKSTLSSME